MEKKIIKETILKIMAVMLSAFLYALCIKLIVQPSGFLAGGVSGLTVLISRYVAIKLDKNAIESILYSVLYILFNLPLFIFGIKNVGKQFITYTIASVCLSSVLVSLIPSSWNHTFQLDSLDLLTSSVVAGILHGVAGYLAFQNGFSQGGTDIISMYLSRSKGKGIGNYNFIMNCVILLIGGIVFKDFVSLIYTIIYFFISSMVVNNLYIGHKKVLIEVVTEDSTNLANKLMEISSHGCTIMDAVGAYSNQNKKIIRMVVSSNQIKSVCELIKSIDNKSFTTLIDVKQVNGKFYVPPMK